MYNFNSTPFYEPLNNGSNAFSNLTLHSVHLSPEELAAIDHGLMSVYGKQSYSASAGSVDGNEKENNNLGFNTPATGTTSKPNNFYGYNTPTPTPMIFTDPKTQNQQNQNQNQNFYNRTPAAQTSAPIPNYTPQNQNFTPFSNQTPKIFDDNLIKSYEERIERILIQEREKYEAMESNYRQQLEQLKRNEFGYSEKLKLEQIIQDLRRQVDNLERQLSESKSSSSSSAAASNIDFDKIEALKLHYDRKISNLVGQFEQEKASALEIMKTKAKAEINLIIPKLKSQLQANLERNQTEIVNKVKGQAQAYIQKLKQDFQMERQVLIEHLRRKHFEEIKQIKSQLQIKFEMKLNEEREKLQNTKTFNSSNSRSNTSTNSKSYNNNYYGTNNNNNNYGNNNAFSYGNGLFDDEPSFLL